MSTRCDCGQQKTRNARQCKECANKARRKKLEGVKHGEERRRKNSDAKKVHAAEGRIFDLAAYMRDKPHPFAVEPGTERIVKDGRVQVKCDDGKWRYRSRIVWEKANGPVPRGLIIHHHDEDPMNDDLANLRMLTRAQHAAVHSTPDKARARQTRSVAARKKKERY